MKNCVCRSSSNHHHSNSVFESSFCHDISWFDVLLEQNLQETSSFHTFTLLFPRVGGRRRRVGQRHTQSFNGSCHGVGGVHTTTSTLSWTSMLNDLLSLLLRNFVVDVLAVGLESTNNIQGSTRRRLFSSSNSTSIHHDTGSVQTSHSHDTPRHVLVTSRQSNQTIVPLCAHCSLNRVGNQITALQRVSHSRGSHRNTVRHTNGIESVSNTIYFLNTRFHILRKFKQMHVTGVAFVPDATNSDLRLVHVLLL
mmetsp:Transcript_124579/g.360280  ORF Transcript_124579/g.360280 Transcript_124579/m.360280 type:complete len:252 (-) Transcript_124579:244-999(-)